MNRKGLILAEIIIIINIVVYLLIMAYSGYKTCQYSTEAKELGMTTEEYIQYQRLVEIKDNELGTY